MAKPDASYYILEALSNREMTGYELTSFLHAKHHAIPEGDGYLFPILLLMEREGLVRSIFSKGVQGKKVRYYGITAVGMYHYRKIREKRITEQYVYEEPVAPETFAVACDVSLSALPVQLTEKVPAGARKHFFKEYTAYFQDALAAGKTEADILASLGDIADLADALIEATDVYKKKVSISPRTWIKLAACILIPAAVALLYFLWGVFLLEISGIIAGLVGIFWLFRITRACLKRRRGYRLIQKAARECGYTYTKRQSVLSSVAHIKPRPSITVRTEDKNFKIRFVTAWSRRKILKFRSPYLYQIFTMRGIAMARTHRTPYAVFFKPKGVSARGMFSLYHTYLVEFDGPMSEIPVYEKRGDDLTVEQVEVLILNPVPLRAAYLKSGETTLVGGETVENVLIHDAPGFSEYLRRLKK